jgi:hypothetical protein
MPTDPYWRVYQLHISENSPPRLVVNTPLPEQGGPADREAAVVFARAEASRIGWNRVQFNRVARTPSGGWSLSIEPLN